MVPWGLRALSLLDITSTLRVRTADGSLSNREWAQRVFALAGSPTNLRVRFFVVAAVIVVAGIVGTAFRTAGAEDPYVEEAGSGASTAINAAAFTETLSGRVYVWEQGRLRPASLARVSTGTVLARTDVSGRFEFQPDQRTGSLTIIQPGYDTVERPIYFNETVIVLRSLVVRAIYVPFAEVTKPSVQAYVHRLVDQNLINAVVIDLKNESGQVYAIGATPTVEQIGASVESETLAPFLETLENRGVYRIGRIVTFMDPWYAHSYPNNALHNLGGGLFYDAMGVAWSSAYSADTRTYNVEIGVAASSHFEEIQYDYVRLPYEDGLRERVDRSEADRVAAINRFAREAGEALHLAGLAVSFDTFGVVSTAGDDQGIGQSVAGIAPHLDYVSPMVYPSGWSPGSFGFSYPPAHPGPVVQFNVEATVHLTTGSGSALVRPWLQDFHDYQARGLFYGADYVHAQIEATASAGGIGFMLWDPSLNYQLAALERALELTWSPLG